MERRGDGANSGKPRPRPAQQPVITEQCKQWSVEKRVSRFQSNFPMSRPPLQDEHSPLHTVSGETRL